MSDCVCDVECQQWSVMPQSLYVVVAAAYNFSNEPVHRQSRVECHTEQLDRVAKRQYCPSNINTACCCNLVALSKHTTHVGQIASTINGQCL